MISAENDHPPPHLPRPSNNELQVSPYHPNIDKFKDKDILEELRARTVELPFSDAIWLKTDHLQNYILHPVARGKPLTLQWLFRQSFAEKLKIMRN